MATQSDLIRVDRFRPEEVPTFEQKLFFELGIVPAEKRFHRELEIDVANP